MAAIQLNFTLRTSANCKTAHLLGSWDGYKGQLPLSKDSSKSGGWKGAFRFPGTALKQGQRYWYYYIIDGYHVSHDPAREFVTEPTTGRKLNVLDIPPSSSTNTSSKPPRDHRTARRTSTASVAKGRPLSISEIKSPRPHNPQETKRIRAELFRRSAIEQLHSQLARTHLDEEDSEIDDSDTDSDVHSDVPSLTSRSSRSSGSSTPSSVSSTSSCCVCERYGITRAGARVKIDCGGSRCGALSSEGSECSSDSDNDYRKGTTRRNGVVMRHSPVRCS